MIYLKMLNEINYNIALSFMINFFSYFYVFYKLKFSYNLKNKNTTPKLFN